MAALKLKEEHITALREATAPFMNKDTEGAYSDAGLSHQRYIWDALWFACKRTPSLNDVVLEIYTYANDTHIHTVLRRLATERKDVSAGT